MKHLITIFAVRISTSCAMLFICFIFSFSISAKAQQLQFTPLLQNLKLPINVKNARDGSGRLFIIEQYGLVKIYKNDSLLSKPFLDIRNLIDTTKYEGIWSIAFPPNYKTSRKFFVYYVDTNGYATLARFATSKNNPDSAVANSGVVLFSLPPTGTDDPHLGEMHFGKDGYLYISINDGSIYNNNTRYAQDGNLFYGKILRLNINVAGAPYYSIPPDNPFINNPDIRDEIWAMGLRNAWRWSFDKNTGNLWLTDVGNARWEEVEVRKPQQASGVNFGWPCYEGRAPFLTDSCNGKSFYTFPTYSYSHQQATSGEVLTGGYVYRGSAYPALYGWYVCIDYTTGTVRMLKPNQLGGLDTLSQTGFPTGIASFGEGENGELYAVSLWEGTVYHIEDTASGAQSFASAATQAITNNTSNIKIYPTLVNNNTIFLQLNGEYRLLQIFDMNSHEVAKQNLSSARGKFTVNLPSLNSGVYTVQLTGTNIFRQKIFITK